MARDTRLQIYVEESTKTQLEREAEEQGTSVSTYAAQLLDRGRTAQAEESLTSRTDVEAALERTIEETIASYHADLLDAVRKASVYSIANYELDATTTDASGALRQDTFETGRRRTRTPLSDHLDTDETEGEESGTDDESNEGDSGDLLEDIRSQR